MGAGGGGGGGSGGPGRSLVVPAGQQFQLGWNRSASSRTRPASSSRVVGPVDLARDRRRRRVDEAGLVAAGHRQPGEQLQLARIGRQGADIGRVPVEIGGEIGERDRDSPTRLIPRRHAEHRLGRQGRGHAAEQDRLIEPAAIHRLHAARGLQHGAADTRSDGGGLDRRPAGGRIGAAQQHALAGERVDQAFLRQQRRVAVLLAHLRAEQDRRLRDDPTRDPFEADRGDAGRQVDRAGLDDERERAELVERHRGADRALRVAIEGDGDLVGRRRDDLRERGCRRERQ